MWRAALLGIFLLPLFAVLAPGAAGQGATLRGNMKDKDGKPYIGIVVAIKNLDQGQNYEVKTDKNGNYVQAGLKGGMYEIAVKMNGAVVYSLKAHVAEGESHTEDINFKDIIAKQGAEQAEAQKKQEEEAKKFEGAKAHFDAGAAELDQAKQARAEMQRAPADQRGPMQEKLTQLADQAATEFQAAVQGMGENDPQRHIVLAKLGETYEVEGKFEEAADAYQKAVNLKPDIAGYYNNLGNVLAKLGKIPEAEAAYQKSATLDPANAATAWRNLGITLYNAGRNKEAIEPLKKSLDIDPKSAQAWYLLGASLVGTMETKKEGDKLIPIIQPGTVEAYQKCVELDPNGGPNSYGGQCKQSLEALQAMGAGIDTKVKNRPAKKN
jgi:tetratricopeptide (TPR) repeat protein